MPVLEEERDDGILLLALNRPEALNALNDELLEALLDGVGRAAHDNRVRAVVLTGRGRGFCAGQDLKEYQPDRDVGEHLKTRYLPLIRAVVECPKPTVAMVNGVAAGAGMSLMLACDLKVAATTATLVQSFVRIGLVPDSGSSYFLTRLVGPSRALEMALLGDPIDASTAYQWGLVNRVVEPEILREATWEWARRLAEGPPLAQGWIKRAIRAAAHSTLEEAMEREVAFQVQAAASQDHRRGLEAFRERRAPRFDGR
ncbi:MAG: enoyl-CoA hydratase/isomerase family protein [Firmicutes bacterium]|nr:enoyl-CoA hydratase/isomerase family protein [Alicyclobacillaceae bacterium]MCL6496153.1 enoyl-CoA hydratase/isomerase family protein [Bacillota bacterium]